MFPLILGIRRALAASKGKPPTKTEVDISARRETVLAKNGYVCHACGYESKPGIGKGSHLDIFHIDDVHDNNQDSNLTGICHSCHPYQHVGGVGSKQNPGLFSEGLGKASLIASIPELSAQDLNLLQRAIGAAMLDEQQAPMAREILEQICKRVIWVKAEFGTYWPIDFAKGMSQLTRQEYEAREDAIKDLRILFNENTLKKFGEEMLDDNPAMPVSEWEEINKSIARKADKPKTE